MKYFITGGEFNNKGSEAMLLTAISNIFEHDKTALIYILDLKSIVPYELSDKITLIDCPDFVFSKITKTINRHTIVSRVKDFIKFFCL